MRLEGPELLGEQEYDWKRIPLCVKESHES